MTIKKELFIILDSNALIHRAFHALPPLATKKGELVNALYGFLLVFLKAIREFQPEYIAAVFDTAKPTFRHKKFKEYKAKRPPTPEGLISQIPKIKEVLKCFGVPIFEKEGFEADDIIASLHPPKFSEKTWEGKIIIISGDLDLLQLVDEETKVYTLKKGIKETVLYDENLVKEKYQGLRPGQLVDFKALRGDPSDNIPGVPGVGEKTAIELLLKFGSLEKLYQEIEKDSQKISRKLKEILEKNKEKAFLSKSLVQLEKEIPLNFDFKKCQWKGSNKKEVIQILEKFEFYSLINRLPNFEIKPRETQKLF